MITQIKHIEMIFQKNIESVYDLMDFDKLVLNFAIISITNANDKLKKLPINNPQMLLDNTITQLRSIGEHGSLKPKYNIMLNQCIVLMVSYFGSTVEEIFKIALKYRLKHHKVGQLSKEEIKITIGELEDLDFNLSDSLADILILKKDISFQDMQSIGRSFNEYFGFMPKKDIDVHNIIMAQACRHAIVHAGCIINNRTLKQVSAIVPREIKNEIKLNDTIQFSKDEIHIIGESMKKYVNNIILELNAWINNA